MKINITVLLTFTFFLIGFTSFASTESRSIKDDISESKLISWSTLQGLEYRLKGGFNIGGFTPLPLPSEIREINSYHPTLLISLEGDVIQWITPKTGILIGLRFENKGMKTDARVKNYGMQIKSVDGGKMEGVWTGNVTTEVQNSYITLPLLGIYQLTPRFEMQGGIFLSYLLKGQFTGYVYEGYLRENDPTGVKVTFEGNSNAVYDFTNDLSNYQAGAQIGFQWHAYKHLNIFSDLTWGFTPLFKSDFKTISFNMFPVYTTFGFSYLF